MPSKIENIVVSGISGRFPECLNIKQFKERILAGDSLITHDDERWPLGTYNLPTGSGKIRRLEDFDAEYFGYTDAQADLMDPLDRLMITQAYKAVMDAGVNPETLRGSNTGFFFGSFVDEVQSVFKDKFDAKGDIFQHHASRIHEALDLKGPSCWLENGCATSLSALHIAVNSIQNGLCDQALVGGVNITMDPTKVDWQMLYETLSADSICHVFDAKACGYVKGEAAVVVFIQKKSKAKRIYAEILGMDTNHDGYKKDGFTHPGWRTQRDLILTAMKRAEINGNDYEYYEAHGTGTQAGDKCELRSIYESVCRDRNRPLIIGSIKSITGHAEGASGLVSLAKIIIAYQCRVLAPNLNYEKPNPNIPYLTDGTYSVPTKAIPFEGGVCGINNFGIGGGNSSLVIKSYDDRKATKEDYDIFSPLPRLIVVCGRNKKMVNETLEEIEEARSRITRGYLSLLNDISNMDCKRGMKARGYLLLDRFTGVCTKRIEDVLTKETGEKRPVWFVFDGLGSQWSGMAKEMMNVKMFANSVYQSIKYLISLDYDNDLLHHYLFNGSLGDKKREPLIVSLVVIQIAFYETLTQLGIKPDAIIGYSIGEIAATFADGCLKREEALKIAIVAEQQLAKLRDIESGRIIEVDLPLNEGKKLCQKTIDLMSVNAPDLLTLSGSTKDIEELSASLKLKNITIRPVSTNNLWMHNQFWAESYSQVLKIAFRDVRVRPITRTSRFKSQYECSESNAIYFAKSLLQQAPFFEVIKEAPKYTMFVEMGPSNQLSSSIFKSFEQDYKIDCIELMKSTQSGNEFVFLESLGRLYASGQDIELNLLYPSVQYPVTRNTDFLSPIFRFDHSKPRFVTKYPEFFRPGSMNQLMYEETIALTGDHKYFSDHSVDGLVLYPATGYLYLAWKTIALYHTVKDYLQFPVQFKHINISRATKLSEKETVLKCTYFNDTGSFVIEANNTICTTGVICPLKKDQFIKPTKEIGKHEGILMLDKKSFYRELRVRGYHFGSTFQNVLKINDQSMYSMVKWTNNIITYLDAILQSSVMTQELRLLYVPTLIESLKVDPDLIVKHLRYCDEVKMKVADVYLDHNSKLIHAPGVEVLNASFKPIARKIEETGKSELVVESCELIGYEEKDAIDVEIRQTILDYIKKCDSDENEQLDEIEDKSKTCGLFRLCHANQPLNLDLLSHELDLDRLHLTLTSDRFFRTQLDVVIENINLYTKFNVLEINSSQQLIYPKLVKIISRPLFGFSMNNLIYTMAHSNENSLPESIHNGMPMKIMKFDLPQSCIPYRELCPQEFIIYRDPRISLDQINEQIDHDLLIRSMQMALAENGFLLTFLRESVHPLEERHCSVKPEKFRLEVESFIKFAEEAGLEYIGKKSDTFTCCSILFRKVEKIEHNEKIIEIFNDNLDWLEILKAANQDEKITRIWIHSTEPHSGIVGLIRGLAKDIARNKIKYIYYDPSKISFLKALNISRKTQLLQNSFIGDKLGSYRHITFSDTPDFIDNVEKFELRQIKSGDLSSFRPFVKQPLTSVGYDESIKHDLALGPHENVEKLLVDVKKSALNFRDVMIASARMDSSNVSDHMAWDDVVLGFEFAGIIRENGQRVMGFDNCKGLSVNIVANREFLWPVPSNWTLEQAVTVPCVYATCYYGLIIRANIQQGESILIHAGTGGIGLAAINICLSLNCNVFVTVGTAEKKKFIRETYPQINPKYIGNSRDCSFETMVMQETGGRGVDLVLNSLTNDMFWASLRCLADNGRFVEIGKYQFMNNDLMDARVLLHNKTFMGVHLDRLFPGTVHERLMTPKATRERKQIWNLLNEGIKSGVVKPLPFTIFKYNQVESAFRFMSTGKHIGKVVINFDNEQPEKPLKVKAIPRTYFEPTKSYIITGGLGGMGLELMFWMQERGARKFVLTSRSGVKTATQKLMIKMVKQHGCQVMINSEDGGLEMGAQAIIDQAQKLGPIGGIFLSTLVLANESIDKITTEMYEVVMHAKSTQALIFDRLLRKLNYPLDYFVGFSSISAGRGFPGQTNYAFANSILERVCEKRRKNGLHGIAIQWGMIGDVGYVADNIDVKESIRGYKPQPIISCWMVMDRLMQTNHSVCGSFVRVEMNAEKSVEKISLLDLVCNVMGIKDKTKLDSKATLSDLGLDSMMATEIGNIFENEFHVAMTSKDIRALTIEKISTSFNK